MAVSKLTTSNNVVLGTGKKLPRRKHIPNTVFCIRRITSMLCHIVFQF